MREETKKQKADVLAVEILQLVRASLLPHLRCMEDARCPWVFIPMPKGRTRPDCGNAGERSLQTASGGKKTDCKTCIFRRNLL